MENNKNLKPGNNFTQFRYLCAQNKTIIGSIYKIKNSKYLVSKNTFNSFKELDVAVKKVYKPQDGVKNILSCTMAIKDEVYILSSLLTRKEMIKFKQMYVYNKETEERKGYCNEVEKYDDLIFEKNIVSNNGNEICKISNLKENIYIKSLLMSIVSIILAASLFYLIMITLNIFSMFLIEGKD